MSDLEYKELLDDIFVRFPSVQNSGFGKEAYKPGLEHMVRFLELLGNPHRAYRTVHVAGTNGKGSVCNMLASVLGAKGYKTGLYTSPHILDFMERMRIGKDLVPKEYVGEFLKKWKPEFERLELSFFEITTGLAFKWFADSKADWAVIEVGLGGRLDSTNVIIPKLSIITSIGLDHCDLLGDTLEKIAYEKAGIIKPGVPVVIGERRPETEPVFRQVAAGCGSPLTFAPAPGHASLAERMDLQGECQQYNLETVLAALQILDIQEDSLVYEAIANTADRMDFHGRWEMLCRRSMTICDIGHNAHALSHNFAQLERMVDRDGYDCLIIVYAVMADKDLSAILPLMPRCARYIFTTPKGKRALPAAKIKDLFLKEISTGQMSHPRAMAIDSVKEAVLEAFREASAYNKPLIYIGGSTFAVAEAVPAIKDTGYENHG
ncbi:MAG: bifunctional folylpolyglutamate synthase/dihydrofolate synthase [Bacteroidales bacterium]|nr:bifunctional folylpolyglutamate synthase/dihydrofolate synthase [Bacteroidales bacterium]